MGCTAQGSISQPLAAMRETDSTNVEQRIYEQKEMTESRKKREILDYTTLLREYSLLTPPETKIFDELDTESNMMISPLSMYKFITGQGYAASFVQMLRELRVMEQGREEMFVRPEIFQEFLETNGIVLE